MRVLGSRNIAANRSRQGIAEGQGRRDIRGRRMPKVLVLVVRCDICTSTELRRMSQPYIPEQIAAGAKMR